MSTHKDEFQQAYLDYELPERSITKLLASSGSGKSTTIAKKISLLLKNISESELMAITFTNKSAWDLNGKIKETSGITIPYCSTIHGLSIKLLKLNDAKPIVMNEWQSLLLIRKIMETHGLSTGTKKLDTVLAKDLLSKYNFMRTTTYECNIDEYPYLDNFTDITISLNQLKSILKEYNTHKLSKNLWDFQDLISPRSETLIKKKPNFKNWFLDECIDINSSVKLKIEGIVFNSRIMKIDEYIKQGFSVKIDSPDGWVRVTQYIPKGIKETIKIEMEDGRKLICTPDHKIETYNRGWVEAQHLIIEDDKVITINSIMKIKSITNHVDTEVCDISIDHPNHRFYANNISVHNCQDTSYDQYIWLFNLFADSAITLVGDVKQELYCIDTRSKIEVLHRGKPRKVPINSLESYPTDGSVKIMSRHGWATFTEYIPKGMKKTIKLTFDDKSHLICTPDHEIETADWGWVRAGNLPLNSSIIGTNNKRVVGIKWYKSIEVCDISIAEDHHSFYANGISVHNCFRQSYSYPLESNEFFKQYGDYVIKEFPLANNYRSTANIVKLFNATAKKYENHLPSIPFHPEVAGSVKVVKFEENTQEGHFIAKKIREMISEGTSPSDIVILSRRSSYLKQVVEPALVEKQIPYILSTPQHKIKFFAIPVNALYFAILQYLISGSKLKLAECSSSMRGIGKTTQDRLVSEMMNSIPSTSNLFDNYIDVIEENSTRFVSLTQTSMQILKIIPLIIKEDLWSQIKLDSIHKTFISFIKYIQYENADLTTSEELVDTMLESIYDYHTSTENSVTLTTIHSYKGLESKVVFIGDMSYIGSLDIDKSTFPVVYVALSRAIKHCCVVYSEKTYDRKFGLIKSKLHPALNYTFRQLGII